MQGKKDLILSKCHDLIYEEALNMPYDRAKFIYASYQIEKKVDDFLTDLIKRGEFFYGNNFVNDFVKEKTDTARRWLLNDIMYGNGIDIETKKPSEKEDETAPIDVVAKENKNPVAGVKDPEEETTYETLLDQLTKDCGWPVEVANQFIKDKVKDEKIKREAEEALNDIAESNKEPAPTLEPITKEEATPVNSPIEVKTKEPKPSLLKRFKEKLKEPKFRRKLIIAGVVIAIGAVAAITIALSPELQGFFNGLLNNVTNTFSGNEINSVTDVANLTNGVDVNSIDLSSIDTSNLDTSSWNMEGMTVYDSASDAVNGINAETANEWFSSDIQGVYDTNTGQMLNLSPEEMQNADYLKNLLNSNQDLSVVFGNGDINSLNEVSGFASGTDVTNLIDQGRSR